MKFNTKTKVKKKWQDVAKVNSNMTHDHGIATMKFHVAIANRVKHRLKENDKIPDDIQEDISKKLDVNDLSTVLGLLRRRKRITEWLKLAKDGPDEDIPEKVAIDKDTF